MLDVHPPHNPTHTWPDFLIHIATIGRSPKFLSANGATYTSLGRSPRFPTRRSPFRSAEGRSGAAGGTTKLPSSLLPPPRNPASSSPNPVNPPNTAIIAKPPMNTGDLYFHNLA
jgi:hypothetical protein